MDEKSLVYVVATLTLVGGRPMIRELEVLDDVPRFPIHDGMVVYEGYVNGGDSVRLTGRE